ncbi:MAG: hypothetical protein QOD04_5646 [Pseudonocardiales bacterium]|jgi:hypothetical protein|nr:hypothetical protein [Pseudonocardiales bacterium]
MFINVLVPEPDSPISATISPSAMLRFTSCSAGTVTRPPVRYALLTSSSSITAYYSSGRRGRCVLAGRSPFTR